MIIGLTGPKGVGKDTLANHLVEHYGFTRLAFADSLKEFLEDANPVVAYDEYLSEVLPDYSGGWDDAKRQNCYVRDLLTNYGDCLKKHFGQDVFVNALANKVKGARRVVISDVRYTNEAWWVLMHNNKGQVWRLYRDGVTYTEEHSSETPLPATYVSSEIYLSNLNELDKKIQERIALGKKWA